MNFQCIGVEKAIHFGYFSDVSVGEQRETEVLSAFIDLLSQYVPGVKLLETPDRMPEHERQFSQITTDGLIELDFGDRKVLIAADAMVLATSRDNLAYNKANDIFGEIAALKRIHISLRALEPMFRSELDGLRESLEEALAESPSEGAFEFRPGIQMAWRSASDDQDLKLDLEIGVLHTHSIKLSEQICHENFGAIRRKTKENGQAARAHASGVPYVLILDGLGHSDVIQGTHWLAEMPVTYQSGILMALEERQDLVSAIFYLSRKAEWSIFKNDIPELNDLAVKHAVEPLVVNFEL
jgi:hypothetical protein